MSTTAGDRLRFTVAYFNDMTAVRLRAPANVSITLYIHSQHNVNQWHSVVRVPPHITM